MSHSARGHSIGEHLLVAAAREVVARDGTRIVFTTDSSDEAAQRFYDRLGAARLPNLGRNFDGDKLTMLARRARG